jgi:hypothetical protein
MSAETSDTDASGFADRDSRDPKSAAAFLPWRARGVYLESCNCEAICPCRRIDGVPGGRSTYGTCFGALSWLIEEGHAGEVSLADLRVVLVYRYEDDEPGSPWRFVLHVDARAPEALEAIFLGRLGGEGILALPWVRKASNLIDVRPSRIEIEHRADAHRIRMSDAVLLQASSPFETTQRVSCIVPGHHVAGTELLADRLLVDEDEFAWDLTGNCAFLADFDYRSSDGS